MGRVSGISQPHRLRTGTRVEAIVIALALSSALAFFGGVGLFLASKSAVHETNAFLLIVVAAVCGSGAAVVAEIRALRPKSAAKK